MQFFGITALILTLIATGLFIPILIKYINTGLVPNFPTLIVCGFIELSAIISFFSGLILATIVEKDRQEFEFRLNLIQLLKDGGNGNVES